MHESPPTHPAVTYAGHMTGIIIPFGGKTPRIHPSAFIAPTATIIGDVEIGEDASVFYGAVLRGDIAPIRVGARSNIQDNCVLHVETTSPAILEEDVTLGHMALVHGAHIKAGSLIGMKAAVLSGATVGSGSLIAAGSVVLEGSDIPPRSLAAGVPAKIKRELTEADAEGFIHHAAKYVITAQQHIAALAQQD